MLNICAGLRAEQLAARPLPTTELSLQGIVRHLAKVERIWLLRRAAGLTCRPVRRPGRPGRLPRTDPADAPAEVEQLRREWAAGDAAVAAVPFEKRCRGGRPRAAAPEASREVWSLRMIYVHLIAEYARHNGHADLLREAIDGVTGR